MKSIFFQVKSLISSSSNELNKEKIIELTNKERSLIGLKPLKENQLLNNAAKSKAQDMAQNNYFGHQDPQGQNFDVWVKKANYPFYTAGENLGLDFVNNEKLLKELMLSPLHKKNILDPEFEEIGIGISQNKDNTNLVVQIFAQSQESFLQKTQTQKNTMTIIPTQNNNLKETNHNSLWAIIPLITIIAGHSLYRLIHKTLRKN